MQTAPAKENNHTSVKALHPEARQGLAANIMKLQQTLGNRAALGIIQTQLMTGRSDDQLEREADSVADRVVRSGSALKGGIFGNSISRISSAASKKGQYPGLQASSIKHGRTNSTLLSGPAAQPGSIGSGSPLPVAERSYYESRLGQDFSHVRIHTGPEASAAAASINARAFTAGSDIVFNQGQYSPGTESGRRLIAHELTHTIQQGASHPGLSRSSPRIQRKEGDQPKEKWYIRAGRAIKDIGRSIEEGAASLLVSIPGYKLFTVLIGHDLVKDVPVEQNAENLIKAFPGGDEFYEKLAQSGALAKAYNWLIAEYKKMNLSWDSIKQAVADFDLDALRYSAKAVWEFAKSVGGKIMEFVFEAILSTPTGKRLWSALKKAGGVITRVYEHPIEFAVNFMKAVKGGFEGFKTRFGEYLKDSLFDWLFSEFNGVVQLPKKLDLMGFLSIALQVMGITYANIRAKLVNKIHEENVARIESAKGFIKSIISGEAIDQIFEFGKGLVDEAIDSIKNWVTVTVVQGAVQKLVGMLIPGAAVIEAIRSIYQAIDTIMSYGDRIAQFIDSIFDSIGNIAEGKLTDASAYVENSLKRILTVAIAFLAGQLHLGKIVDVIKKIIKKIQDKVDPVLNKIVDWIVAIGKSLIAFGKKTVDKGKQVVASGVAKIKGWVFPEHKFEVGGEQHTLFIEPGEKPDLSIRSTPVTLRQFLRDYQKKHPNISKEKKKDIEKAETLIKKVETDRVRSIQDKLLAITKKDGTKMTKEEKHLAKANQEIIEDYVSLTTLLKGIIGEDTKWKKVGTRKELYALEGAVGNYQSMMRAVGDNLTPDHQPQNSAWIFLSKEFKNFPTWEKVIERAARRSATGYTINLHRNRHVPGRTYGKKLPQEFENKTKDIKKNLVAKLKDNKLETNKMNRKEANNNAHNEAKKAISDLLRKELDADVKKMIEVADFPLSNKVYKDIQDLKLDKKEKEELHDQVRDNIQRGEMQMKSQNLDLDTLE